MALQDHLDGWTPDPVQDTGVIAAEPVAALAAVLDLPPTTPSDTDRLPPLWHWLQLLEWPARGELGPDGHPAHGRFLPPIPDRRRMFAGGRVRFDGALEIGAPVRRTSEVTDCTVKTGTSGELAFVTVRSTWSQHGIDRVVEDIDYVYRSGDDTTSAQTRRHAPVPTEPPSDESLPDEPGTDPAWRLVPDTSPVTLFRFSALTANSHRIHYDQAYARDVEGYPDLVVHGPLLVLFMTETARRADPRPVTGVTFRLRRPVFSGMPVVVRGGPATGTADTAAMTVASAADERHAVADVHFAH